jgi:hypothetical protein
MVMHKKSSPVTANDRARVKTAPGSTLSCFLAPCPGVYLAHAVPAIVAILASLGMNKLRACSVPVGSNPTRVSNLVTHMSGRSSSTYERAGGRRRLGATRATRAPALCYSSGR